MTGRWVLAGGRLVAVGLVLAAVLVALVIGARRPTFSAVNFLSYFTVLSNLVAAGVLLVGALRTGRPSSPRRESWRGAAVLYLTITGIVYAALLSGADVGTPPFANWILHRIMPVLLVVDWLVDPPRTGLSVRRALSWLLFPLAYLAYTLIRGPIVDWYPYPFLDPRPPGGYGVLALTCAVIAVGAIVLAALIVAVGNAVGRRRAAPASP